MSTNSGLDDLEFGETLRGFCEGQTVFGRYRLEKILGRGGMGVVWLGWDGKLERKVALKFLPEMVVRDKLAVNDLKRETKRCLEITHPHIVRVYDFLEDEARGMSGIAMEYVDGDNLSNLRVDRDDRCFEVSELSDWAKALCEALEYAHGEVKVVHRDLKPANLMVTSDGKLKVADFGIARSLVNSMSRVSANVGSGSGTLVYMSPQQALGEPSSALDDIYALGATLYDLLTGRPPFYTGNVYEQLKERVPPTVSARRLELQAGKEPVPVEWEETIAACLEKDPSKRPQSVGEVEHLLGLTKGYMRHGAAGAPKRDTIRVSSLHPKVPAHTNETPIAVLAGVLVLAVCASCWWYGIEQPRKSAELAFMEAAARKRQEDVDKAQKLAAEAQLQKEQAEAKSKAELAEAKAEKQRLEEEAQRQAEKVQWQRDMEEAKARAAEAERQRLAIEAQKQKELAERQNQALEEQKRKTEEAAQRSKLESKTQQAASTPRPSKGSNKARPPGITDAEYEALKQF